jgi:chromosome transmission fidelity protein 18
MSLTNCLVYRDIDALANFETSAAVIHGTQAPTRYAVRQVLDQELQKERILRDNLARQSRFRAGNPLVHEDFTFDNKENDHQKSLTALDLPALPVKKDSFGRVIKKTVQPLQEASGNAGDGKRHTAEEGASAGEAKIWVTFHEGLNNAVKKPISLQELLRGL